MSTSTESRRDDLVECCEFSLRGRSLYSGTWTACGNGLDGNGFWPATAVGVKEARVGVVASSGDLAEAGTSGSWGAVLGRGVAGDGDMASSLMSAMGEELTARKAPAMIRWWNGRAETRAGSCGGATLILCGHCQGQGQSWRRLQ